MLRTVMLFSILIMFVCHKGWGGGTPAGTAFTYQGVLSQGGAPANGTYYLRFQLWNAVTSGSQIGADVDHPSLSVSDGLVSVELDFGSLAFNGDARWLQVQIIDGSGGATTLVPRQAVAAAPYALHAFNIGPIDVASLPTGGTWTLSSGLNLGNGTVYVDPTSNRVGIGTSSPSTALDVTGTARVTGFQMPTGAASGKVLRSDSSGVATWQNDGVTFPCFGNGSGSSAMFDLTSSGTGAPIKVRGIGGYGIEATSDHGPAAIRGSRIQGDIALDGYSRGLNAIGVRGVAEDLEVGSTVYAYGGYFTASSFESLSRGVYGRGTVGGYLTSGTSQGIGAHGFASSTSGFTTGVFGETRSPVGVGVYGLCVPSTGTGKGVYGECPSATGHGVYSLGRFAASGTKAFRIDHPDDPANKYLNHYCAESPEVINFYSGKVKLDGTGQAVVELPAYFAKINRDPRYTLTAIGAAMPNLHVSMEIDEASLEAGASAGPHDIAPLCAFRIAGGVAGAKVSWRVEAVRNDLWMRRNGALVEEDKVEHERGLYQQPELYDLPLEMSVFRRPETADAGDRAADQRTDVMAD